MQKDYEFLQDFIDDIHAETLDSSSQRITFPSGWSAICNQQYEGDLRPPQVLGRILQFQLQTKIPIISRKDRIADTTCKRPPVLPLYIVEPGRVFSLEYLSDQIRVIRLDFPTWHMERRHFPAYIERERAEVPHFGIFYQKQSPSKGLDETQAVALVMALSLDSGYLFQAGDNQGAGVDGLLIGLWRQMMEKSFPHYQ